VPIIHDSSSNTLQYILGFCNNRELEQLTLVDKEMEDLCENEWRLRMLAKYGPVRYTTTKWRKIYKLRHYFEKYVIKTMRARIYLMNQRGETTYFSIPQGQLMMCSRERAIVYNRCERMFDLSLRINRSIQEISALIGIVSLEEARSLLNEHINLMSSVASLRSSLMFESELFKVFPAPILLDANNLLRGTYTFEDPSFIQDTKLMMQMWGSIDGMIYRPLAPPAMLERQGVQEYESLKLHELSGMTIQIDDNTMRYRFQETQGGNKEDHASREELCINALVSNTYMLYLFNPINFRPLDWTYQAVLQIGNSSNYELPEQREGVFLNNTSYAMRVFLSYGKIPESSSENGANEGEMTESIGTRGSENSHPLELKFPNNQETATVSFKLVATNRITRQTKEIIHHTTPLKIKLTNSVTTTCASGLQSTLEASTTSLKASSQEKQIAGFSTVEHQVHLPFDALISYCISHDEKEEAKLQYIEFAIGFEPLLDRLGITSFLLESSLSKTKKIH
jgi:hypothetical protein